MSLNGLDDLKVTDAFQTAAAEPGGWFLLNYTSRDQVHLFGSGTGGISELRTSLESDADSPLYGYIKYRRRNVVLKYLPQDSSRLIQARVAVHFNFVCERLSPYDVIFAIDSPKALTDTKLSAACSLHTASGSTSSSTSSRQKRLVEIAEEEEDEHPPTKRKSLAADLDPPKALSPNWNSNPVILNADLASSPEQSKFSADDTTEPPTFVGSDERPSTSRSHDLGLSAPSSYSFAKAKVKLGPRPSLDTSLCPQTAGNFRPVSAIPSGYTLFGKSGKKNKNRDSSIAASQHEIDSLEFSTSVEGKDAFKENTDPALVSLKPDDGLKPARKTVSPEKARLKKAMQLRAKKRLAAAINIREGAAKDTAAITAIGLAEAEAVQEALVDKQSDTETAPKNAADPKKTKMASEHATAEKTDAQETESLTNALSTSSLVDQISELTGIDSHPASPALGDSETARSTAASFISDATEQVAREKSAEPDSEIRAGEHIRTAEATLFGNSAIDAALTENTVAIPISKFSTNNSTSPTEAVSATRLPVQSKQNDGYVASSTPAEPQFSAQDLVAATRAAAEPYVEVLSAEQINQSENAHLEPDQEPFAVAEVNKMKEPVSNGLETSIPSGGGLINRKGVLESIQSLETQDSAATAVSVIAKADKSNTSVAEAPVTPITPETSGVAAVPLSPSATPHSYIRTVSNPVRGNLIPPSDVSQSTSRSMSSGAAYLHKITQQQQQQSSANLSSKSNVGSSISQRIKALELLSVGNASESRPVSRERPQSTFFSVKKSEPLRAPSVMERASSLRKIAPPSHDDSDSSPDTARPQKERSGSISNRLSVFQAPLVPLRGNSESISVTAKIVRDANHQVPQPPGDIPGFNPLHLKQSPLFVSHQRPNQELTTAVMDDSVNSYMDDGGSPSVDLGQGLMEKSSTCTDSTLSVGAQSPLKGSVSPHLSMASSFRRSPKKVEEVLSFDSTEAAATSEDKSDDSKLSRASRFMRRLSTLSSSRSKNTLPAAANADIVSCKSSAVQDDERRRVETPRPSTTGASPWVLSYLGDVNVQFPDNLLWKRRNMSIDSQGFLVLSALPAPSSRGAQGTKRYHLSEFRPPYSPDVEVQELPNSVVLDFIEGTSLQFACEDRSGQLSVLNDLMDAHSRHARQFGQ